MKNPMRCVSRHHWDHPGSRPDFQVPRLARPSGLGYFGMAVPDCEPCGWSWEVQSSGSSTCFAMFRDVFEYILSKAYEKDMVWFILKSLYWMDVPQNFNPQTRFKPDARCYNLNAPTSACCDRNELPLPATPLTPLRDLERLLIWIKFQSDMTYSIHLIWSKWRHFLQWYFPCSLHSVIVLGEFQWLFPLDPWIRSPPVAWIWPSAACGRRKRPWSAWAPAMLRRG